MAAVDVRDAVVAGEPLVDERVVGRQQIDDAAILAQLAFEEQLGLALKRLAEVVVEIGKLVGVGGHGAQVAQVQPLSGEARDERPRSRIGKHPADLPFEHRGIAQLSARRGREQLVVGDAAPQEE